MTGDSRRITSLLRDWSEGRESAADELLPLVYPALRRIAAHHLAGERRGHTLQPTALVNEAYMRLVGMAENGFDDRSHFLGMAARLMRNILVDHARRRHARKRGGGDVLVTLNDGVRRDQRWDVEIVELDLALERLGAMDRRAERTVELKFFAGLTLPEIAETLGVSIATVKRDWMAARAFLYQQLSG